MFPIPFSQSERGLAVLVEQISPQLIVFSHVPTALVSLAFAIFLYKQTKKVSALYLLLVTITFTCWSYYDLVSWSAPPDMTMFTWSLLDIFNGCFVVLSYWFIYAFVKERDLPVWQKISSLAFLIPTFIYTIKSMNINTFYVPTMEAFDAPIPLIYITFVEIIFILLISVFSILEYRKEKNTTKQRTILLSGIGVVLFLSIFSFIGSLTTTLIQFGITTSGEAYNITLFSLFGMPILVGLLGYLIAKYEAFDLKLVKSIQAILFLMALLFVYIFI